MRAGERKTGWTKPLPPSPGLWALNAPGRLKTPSHDGGELPEAPGLRTAVRPDQKATEPTVNPREGAWPADQVERWPIDRLILRGSNRASCGKHEGVGLDEPGTRRRGGRGYRGTRQDPRCATTRLWRSPGHGRARLVRRAKARLCDRRQSAGDHRLRLGHGTPRPRARRTEARRLRSGADRIRRT